LIHWEVRGRVGVATIDRPERRNALNVELCRELHRVLDDAAGTVRCLVVTGAGGAFCAGADISTRFTGGDDEFRPAFEGLLNAVVDFPAPVIAAAEGPALGAGTQLSVACDLRIAAPNAIYGIPAARLGLMLNPENVQRLALLVGFGAAKDMLVTGRRVTADEARTLGLIHRVAEENVLDAALVWADEIAALAPLTVQGHKRALNALARRLGFDRHNPADASVLADLDAATVAAFRSDDMREGVAAFNEKRPPTFGGH